MLEKWNDVLKYVYDSRKNDSDVTIFVKGWNPPSASTPFYRLQLIGLDYHTFLQACSSRLKCLPLLWSCTRYDLINSSSNYRYSDAMCTTPTTGDGTYHNWNIHPIQLD